MTDYPPRVLRFRIALAGIEPPIWRLIDVPEAYSFWDLHVAIQDSMGWLDYHLHSFNPPRGDGGNESMIGIPGPDFDDGTVAGWEVPITTFFMQAGDGMEYKYDFGDGWSHTVDLVDSFPEEPDRKYPICVDGGRACPPEDCGGVHGYTKLLKILSDRSHDEHAEMAGWLKGHAVNYWPYEPDEFDPASVEFDDARERFEIAFPQL